MINAVLVVWREAIEALLVVGILHAWLTTRGDRARLRFLWGGAVAGLGFAGLLAFGLLALSEALEGEAFEYVQGGMTLAAAVLITHMVFWMRRHGRTLKSELETGLARATTGIAVGALTAIAIGREGAETVVFLYGLGVRGDVLSITAAIAAGVTLALVTFWALKRSASRFGWRAFFTVTGVMLLALAGALLVSTADRFIGMGLLPPGPDPLWDSSGWLDDQTGIGNWLAAFAGYRARPATLTVALLALFWIGAMVAWRRADVAKPS
jgi:high-affinity iron transporter